MKKILTLIFAILLSVPLYTNAAPVQVNRLPNGAPNHIEPLVKTDSIWAPFFKATTTTATSTFAGLLSVGTTTATTTAKLMVDGGVRVTSSNNAVVIGNTFGNARGTNALDIQSNRTNTTQVASGANSVAVGLTSIANASRAVALGSGNQASGGTSSAVGNDNTVSGGNASAYGYGNNTSGTASQVFGYQNTEAGGSNMVFGITNVFDSPDSSGAFGLSNTLNGSQRSYAFGDNNTVNTIQFGYSLGYGNVVGADNAMAIGYQITNGVANSIEIGTGDTSKVLIKLDDLTSSGVQMALNTETPQSTSALHVIGLADSGAGFPSQAIFAQNNGSLGSGTSAQIGVDDSLSGIYNGTFSSFLSDTGGAGYDFWGNGNSYFSAAEVGTLSVATLSSNVYRAATGTLGAPSYSFTIDTNTGMYRTLADTLSFQTAGAQRLVIDPNGNVGIGTTTPTSKLVVRGTAGVSTNDVLNVASSTNATVFAVNGAGNIETGGGTPTIGANCGTSATLTTGSSDTAGSVTLTSSGAVNACTITFSKARLASPISAICNVGGTYCYPSARSTTAVTFSFGFDSGGLVMDYLLIGQ